MTSVRLETNRCWGKSHKERKKKRKEEWGKILCHIHSLTSGSPLGQYICIAFTDRASIVQVACPESWLFEIRAKISPWCLVICILNHISPNIMDGRETKPVCFVFTYIPIAPSHEGNAFKRGRNSIFSSNPSPRKFSQWKCPGYTDQHQSENRRNK